MGFTSREVWYKLIEEQIGLVTTAMTQGLEACLKCIHDPQSEGVSTTYYHIFLRALIASRKENNDKKGELPGITLDRRPYRPHPERLTIQAVPPDS